jgi:hypothetical protein
MEILLQLHIKHGSHRIGPDKWGQRVCLASVYPDEGLDEME